MKIKFDPTHTEMDLCSIGSRSRTRSKSHPMSGGGLNRCEYMDLCRQMTSRDTKKTTRANRDKLLTFLKAYVIEHSAEYSKEKQGFIMENIPTLFENPAMLEDPNYVGSYNLVAFQCCILFTIMSRTTKPNSASKILYNVLYLKNLWNNYDAIRDIIVKRQIHLYINTETPHTETMDIYDAKGDLSISETLCLYRLYSAVYINTHPLYLITIVSYLYIQEFIDAIVHNVYYCGLAYKYQTADGTIVDPMEFLMHDYVHSEDSLNLFKKKSRIYFEKLYTLIMKTTFNKGIRYSILLLLFYLLHEDSQVLHTYIGNYKFTYFTATLSSGTKNLLAQRGRFYDPDDFRPSIPKAHRGSEASIDAYLILSFKRFYAYFKAIQDTEDPLPNSAKLSGSAKKLLDLYLDKEVVVSTERLKRLLKTRKVGKSAAKKARGSHS
jgi:hypothetical protein